MREHILAILAAEDIDPDQPTSNGQTAYQRVEAAILGVLEELGDDEP
jgi:hypothetical protein